MRSIEPSSRLAGVQAYQPPVCTPGVELKLDANEGPLPAPEVIEAIAVGAARANRYPTCLELESRLAARIGIDADRIVVTNGGDDAIDRLCRAVLEPGRTMLTHAPTFEMIEHSARLAGGCVRRVEWRDGGLDASRFVGALDDSTAMAAIVSPNNPTGLTVDASTLVQIAEAAPGVVLLVDLAYVEFADADPTPALIDLPNVVMIRTFSKAMGLAGLRVGYGVAPAPIAAWLRAVGGPYPVSGASVAGALASLAYEPACIERVRAERRRLSSFLEARSVRVTPSQANFVLARFDNAAGVHGGLLERGISVRAFGRSELADALRITLPGDEAGFARLTSALGEILDGERA